MFCQQCRQPLRLDSSLEGLNPAAYDLLVSSTATGASTSSPAARTPTSRPEQQSRQALYKNASQNAGPPTFRRHPSGHNNKKDSSMSFIYLTESVMGHPPQTGRKSITAPDQSSASAMSKPASSSPPLADTGQMDKVSRLFELLSARSDIDYPVCAECTDMLVEGLQTRLNDACRERDAYVQYLKQVKANRQSESDVKAQQEALRKAEQDRDAAMTELKKLELEKETLDQEILSLEEESRQLDKEEELFWRERNTFATRMSDFQAERDSVNAKYNNDSQLLEKLHRANVYNDTFCISHDGSFATINGLRLGRLSSKPVDWAEINAAWGHALLLLVTVAKKLDCNFQGLEPLPLGSTSKIVRYDTGSPVSSKVSTRQGAVSTGKKQTLELYSSGDMPLGLTFMHRKFDNAMVAFLELVRQVGEHVYQQTRATDRPLRLPYKIEGDKIGDVSIKLGIAQDDGWSKACKFTLTCCKFLLAHASNVSVGKASGD